LALAALAKTPATGGDPADGLADEAEVEPALEELVAEAGIDAPPALRGVDIADAEWIALGKTDQYGGTLVIGVGEWGADGDYVVLGRVDQGWSADGWGNCNLEPVLKPDVGWVEIVAAPVGLDPAATSIPVDVTEGRCTTGRDPEPYLREPVVVEAADAGTVYWTSDAIEGAADCPGNPVVRRVVELDQPLGNRELLDGSSWPAAPVGGP